MVSLTRRKRCVLTGDEHPACFLLRDAVGDGPILAAGARSMSHSVGTAAYFLTGSFDIPGVRHAI